MAVQKFFRSQLEPVFKTDNVIGIQEKIQVAAAPVKTTDIRVAAEVERIVPANPPPGQVIDILSVYIFHYPA